MENNNKKSSVFYSYCLNPQIKFETHEEGEKIILLLLHLFLDSNARLFQQNVFFLLQQSVLFLRSRLVLEARDKIQRKIPCCKLFLILQFLLQLLFCLISCQWLFYKFLQLYQQDLRKLLPSNLKHLRVNWRTV